MHVGLDTAFGLLDNVQLENPSLWFPWPVRAQDGRYALSYGFELLNHRLEQK